MTLHVLFLLWYLVFQFTNLNVDVRSAWSWRKKWPPFGIISILIIWTHIYKSTYLTSRYTATKVKYYMHCICLVHSLLLSLRCKKIYTNYKIYNTSFKIKCYIRNFLQKKPWFFLVSWFQHFRYLLLNPKPQEMKNESSSPFPP